MGRGLLPGMGPPGGKCCILGGGKPFMGPGPSSPWGTGKGEKDKKKGVRGTPKHPQKGLGPPQYKGVSPV